MRFFTGIIVVALLSCLSLTATAQEKKPRDIKFSSDTADYDENLNRVRLVGDVVIISEGSRLEAPYAVYYTVKQYAEFLGGVPALGGIVEIGEDRRMVGNYRHWKHAL